MNNSKQVSSSYNWELLKSLFSIFIFFLVYLTIGAIAIGLTLFSLRFLWLTITVLKGYFLTVFAVGLVLLSIAITIFVFKFLFKKRKSHESDAIEITEENAPQLFQLIKETAQQVGSRLPHKIYLNGSNNASVKIPTTILGALFSTKFDLTLGLALIQSSTKNELQSIIAHEFGHFSQRSLRINSFIYQVNNLISDMYNDNDVYDEWVDGWSERGLFSMFIYVATLCNNAVKSILSKVSNFANLYFLELSRKMEFHADEISAGAFGKEPLIRNLLRTEFSNYCFETVLGYYEEKSAHNLKSTNIYVDYFAFLTAYAHWNEIPLVSKLPYINYLEQSKYSNSKLIVTNQWSSHPNNAHRIKNLESKFENIEPKTDFLAVDLLPNPDQFQKHFTDFIYTNYPFKGEVNTISTDSFIEAKLHEFEKWSFDKAYKGYFDSRGMSRQYTIDELVPTENVRFSDLFSTEVLQWIYEENALTNDIATLGQIQYGQLKIKSFDYEGNRFSSKMTLSLLEDLVEKHKHLHSRIEQHDVLILSYFIHLEKKRQNQPLLLSLYNGLHQFANEVNDANHILHRMTLAFQFIEVETPKKDIKNLLDQNIPLEQEFKLAIKELLAESNIEDELDELARHDVEKYCTTELEYFSNMSYNDDHLTILRQAINSYRKLVFFKYQCMKKDILNYQLTLERDNQSSKQV